MKFISRAKRRAAEERLAALEESSAEAKVIRGYLRETRVIGEPVQRPAPVVAAPAQSPPPVEEKPVPSPPAKKAPPVVEAASPVEEKPAPKKAPSKAKTAKKTSLFGKKTSTKK